MILKMSKICVIFCLKFNVLLILICQCLYFNLSFCTQFTAVLSRETSSLVKQKSTGLSANQLYQLQKAGVMQNMKLKVFPYSYSNKVNNSWLEMSKLYQIWILHWNTLKANPDPLALSREKLLASQWSLNSKMAAKHPVFG